MRDPAPRPFATAQFVPAALASVTDSINGGWGAVGALLAASAPGDSAWAQAVNATGTSPPSLLWAPIACSAEPLLVSLDLYASSPTLLNTALPFTRGVLLPSGAMLLPLALQPAPAGTPPTGILVTATGGSYTLVGAPAAGVWSAGGVAGAPPASPLHRVNIPVDASAGSPFTALLPPGQLLPGHVYRATASLTLTLAWYTGSVGASWAPSSANAAPAPLLPVGGGIFSPTETVTGQPLAPAQVAWAPYLFTHSPPSGGSLAFTPPTGGIAFTTRFTPSSAGWGDTDALSFAPGAAPPPQGYSVRYSAPAMAALLHAGVPGFPAAALDVVGASLSAGGSAAVAELANAACSAAALEPSASAHGALLNALWSRWSSAPTASAKSCPASPASLCAAGVEALAAALQSASAGTPYTGAPALVDSILLASIGTADADGAAATPPVFLAGLSTTGATPAPGGTWGVLNDAGWSALATLQRGSSFDIASLFSPAMWVMLGTAPSGTPTAASPWLPAPLTLASSSTAAVKVLAALLVADARGAMGVAWGWIPDLAPLPLATSAAGLDSLASTLASSLAGSSGSSSSGSASASGASAATSAVAATSALTSSLASAAAASGSAALPPLTLANINTLQTTIASSLASGLAAGAAAPGGLSSTQLTSAATALVQLTSSTAAPPNAAASASALGALTLVVSSSSTPASASAIASSLTAVLANVASAGQAPPTPTPTPPPGFSTAIPLPNLPTGGAANATMAALASAARSNLALTLLSTAPLGTPVTIPAPTAATAPASGSYCGAASAASFLSISAGAAAGLEVKPPLAPCLSPGAAPPAGLPAPPRPRCHPHCLCGHCPGGAPPRRRPHLPLRGAEWPQPQE